MIFLVLFFLLFILALAAEFFFLEKARKNFAWRIAVGGIRGKSSVTRLIAAALREAGIKVVARTTGSRPMVILPDGREEEINRSGLPNILEGKKFLKLARKEKARALVVELMAVDPECLEAEIKKIFKPQLLIFTNFRPDHREVLGRSREEVSRNLLRAVSKNSTVLLLEEEVTPDIKEFLKKKGVRLILASKREKIESGVREVRRDLEDAILKDGRINYGNDFPENIRLALAAVRFLGLSETAASSGIKKARPDFGSLKIWEYARPGRACGYLVSAFAANEPESSAMVIKKIKEIIGWKEKKIYGLLIFRRDRGDRTSQWLEAIRNGFFDEFDGLFLCECPYFSLYLTLKKYKAYFLRYEDFFKQKFSHKKKEESVAVRENNLEKIWKGSENEAALIEKENPASEKSSRTVFPAIIRLSPEEVKHLPDRLSQKEEKEWLLIGLGNIVGLGTSLIYLWEKKGRRIHG